MRSEHRCQVGRAEAEGDISGEAIPNDTAEAFCTTGSRICATRNLRARHDNRRGPRDPVQKLEKRSAHSFVGLAVFRSSDWLG